ncbi:hypothetical protein L1987_46832 [Smallanthus sonchifolius]|uniref:Uncharacterized protein n=1 Tax=Smallanthus sonchifolius TaxID=185202 RepID=A0ACB9G096_9ASTR|nr:hypothetical protein L1987_46832 [Smallanthus sonchifolius]
MCEVEPTREALEEIQTLNPLSFEALFKNVLTMNNFGEGEAVIRRIEKALAIAEEEQNEKEARDLNRFLTNPNWYSVDLSTSSKSTRLGLLLHQLSPLDKKGHCPGSFDDA